MTAFKTVALFAVSLAPVLAEAYTYDWGSKDGNWGDPANYSWKSDGATFPPLPGSTVRFQAGYAKYHPITVTLEQEGLGSKVELTNESSEYYWTEPITLSGAGESRHLVGSSFSIGAGRELILDNVLFESSHTPGGDTFCGISGGRLFAFNGSELDLSRTSGGRVYFNPNSAAEMRFYGTPVKLDLFYAPNATNFVFEVRDGGSVSFSPTYFAGAQAGGVRIVDGDATIGANSTLPHFFPERSGTATFNGNVEFAPSIGGTFRLGGSAKLATLTPSVPLLLYGRGNLQVGTFSASEVGTRTFDLSELVLGTAYFSARPVTFLGDTDVWPTSSAVAFDGTTLEGRLALHVNPKDGASTELKCSITDLANATPDAGLAFAGTGRGDVTHGLYVSDAFPERLGSLALGENVKLAVTGNGWYWGVRFHDLALDAGAVLDIGQYAKHNQLVAIGDVKIDPTARIKGKMLDSPDIPRPIVTVLDDVVPEGCVEITNLVDGWQLGHNGGSWFYWKGTCGPGCDWGGCWLGKAATCKWSEAENWKNGVVANNSGTTAIFTGFNHLVISNDIADVKVANLKFWGYYSAAPYIFRGEPIKVHSTAIGMSGDTVGVYSTSSFPTIFECDIVSDKEALGLTARLQDRAYDASVLCFRGNVKVPDGTLATCGNIVIDGTATAKDLRFCSLEGAGFNSQVPAKYKRTELVVRRGGQVVVTDQTTANSSTGHFWIAKGGAVSIAGDWKWNDVENEHLVHGSLAVSGALGGSATQTYYGKGVLSVGTTDGSDGATLRVGHGLVLAPTSDDFGDMPIEVLWGGATLAPVVPTAVGQQITVSGLGAQLVASNDVSLAIEQAVAGTDFDLVKRGSGLLTLGGANVQKKGRLILEEGALGFTADQAFDMLVTKPGTKLCYGPDAKIVVQDSVDLSGVSVEPLPAAEGERGSVEVLRVPRCCRITGVETASSGKAKLQVVTNDDGTVSLQAKVRHGLLMIIR